MPKYVIEVHEAGERIGWVGDAEVGSPRIIPGSVPERLTILTSRKLVESRRDACEFLSRPLAEQAREGMGIPGRDLEFRVAEASDA